MVTPVLSALPGVGLRTCVTPVPCAEAPVLSALPGVGLTTLNDRAALQERHDRKYVLAEGQAEVLLAALPAGSAVLEIDGRRDFGYVSTYFDTADLLSFRSAATGRRRRFKVRIRRYVDTGERWLEVKTRGARGLTVKDRTGVPEPWDTGWLDQTLAARGVRHLSARGLGPTLEVAYRRSTLLLPDASRVTIDTDLVWWSAGHDAVARLGGLAIVETKTAGGASPTDRWLWQHGVRPCRLSKYATGLARLYDLPGANRWHRTLTRLADSDDDAP